MRRQAWFGVVMAVGPALAGCATQPAAPLPAPTQVAQHEWAHGPPWGPEEIPWVPPPEVVVLRPFGWGTGFWGAPYWGPSVGIGLGFGRRYGWRGHPGFHHHRGFSHGGGHFRGRGRR